MHSLKRGVFFAEAAALFQSIVASREARWVHFNNTPGIFFPQLDSRVWWTEDAFVAPALRVLTGAQPLVASELAVLVEKGRVPQNDAYFAFKTNNTWSSILLWDCYDGWAAKGCALFPHSCAILRSATSRHRLLLPAPTYCLTNHHERLTVLRVAPGSIVPLHAGITPMINVHIGLLGLDGATLVVAGESRSWSASEAFAFQDSFDHSVYHSGATSRYVLMLTVSHPRWSALFDGARGKPGQTLGMLDVGS